MIFRYNGSIKGKGDSMDLSFKSQEELYIRVRPALNAKLQELKRINYKNITESDIWEYLSVNKWRKSSNLMLSDIVSDIIHIDNRRLAKYLEDKNKRGV